MSKNELIRLLAMIANADSDPDTFDFVVNRIYGYFESQESNKEI